MSRLPRPCLGLPRQPCGQPTSSPTGRCEVHEPIHQAMRRPSSTKRGYDRSYRKDRSPLIGKPCELRLEGCTGVADTADHVTARAGGKRVAGPRGRALRPACKSCNYKRGAREMQALLGETSGMDE